MVTINKMLVNQYLPLLTGTFGFHSFMVLLAGTFGWHFWIVLFGFHFWLVVLAGNSRDSICVERLLARSHCENLALTQSMNLYST